MKLYTTLLSVMFAVILVLSLSSVSALTLTTPNTITDSNKVVTLDLRNDNSVAQNISLSISDITSGSNRVVLSLTPTSITNFLVGGTQTLTVTATSISSGFAFGDYTTTLYATGYDSSTGQLVANTSATIRYTKSFCTSGSTNGNLSIQSVDISSDGDEDETWNALDEITIDVDVENNGEDDVKEVFVELGLFDSGGRNVINDVDFDSTSDDEKYDIGRINDGDEETASFRFTVPADLDAADYKLAVKVYSKDAGQDNECDDSSDDLDNTIYNDIQVDREDDEGRFVVADNFDFQREVACGDIITGSLDLFNIGDDDQDQVKLNIYNKELGIDQDYEIRTNLDQGDKESVDFTLTIPSNVASKSYELQFRTYYDYRSGEYREELEDPQFETLKVICSSGSGSSGSGSTSVTAYLDSDAVAGESVTVKATVTNTGSQTLTYTIDVQGYQSWASLDSVSARSLTLSPGQSQTVSVELTADEDASGSETVTIQASSSDGTLQSKSVNVEFEEGQGSVTGTGFSVGNLTGNSGFLWVLAAINLILIVVIVIVAVRVSRR